MSIRLLDISKSYRLKDGSWPPFSKLFRPAAKDKAREVLGRLSLEIDSGEVVGLVGVNGAGKSTLLKIVAGMLRPSSGAVEIRGKVCALLELGAGFHGEMTGRQNVYLAGAVAGQPAEETARNFEGIVDFAGLRSVIDQPVKTYSSGMVMRLAFSVATSVDPDILILDETLSVGDGAFARKSFDRIMAFKASGKTILFCSHSLYQIEAICNRVLWLDQGRLMMDGPPSEVVRAYNDFLLQLESEPSAEGDEIQATQLGAKPAHQGALGTRLLSIQLVSGQQHGAQLTLRSGQDDLKVEVDFVSDPKTPPPTVGIMLSGSNGRPVTSVLSLRDGCPLKRSERGIGRVMVRFPALPLLRGHYWVNVFLLCEQALHVHESAYRIGRIEIDQEGPELGVVSLQRVWESCEGAS